MAAIVSMLRAVNVGGHNKIKMEALRAAIKEDLFTLEQMEIAHIAAAASEGTLIDQRPNVDILALLGFVVVKDKFAAFA